MTKIYKLIFLDHLCDC